MTTFIYIRGVNFSHACCKPKPKITLAFFESLLRIHVEEKVFFNHLTASVQFFRKMYKAVNLMKKLFIKQFCHFLGKNYSKPTSSCPVKTTAANTTMPMTKSFKWKSLPFNALYYLVGPGNEGKIQGEVRRFQWSAKSLFTVV